MRRVNIAELKKHLRKYVSLAETGEEIAICDRGLEVAKLVPFSAEEVSEQELLLAAAGILRLSRHPIDVDELLQIPTGHVSNDDVVQALLDE